MFNCNFIIFTYLCAAILMQIHFVYLNNFDIFSIDQIFSSSNLTKRQRKPKGQSRVDNPEARATKQMGNADPKNQGALNLVDKRMISTEKLSKVQVSIKYHSLDMNDK